MGRNIVITGFMGVGKSTVGQALAQKLNYEFVDMDDLIEERQGRTIREIFETEGETFFRQLESALCRELSGRQGQVIATGGGALVNPENLAIFSARHLVICLDCDPEVLWLRLAAAENRPMLDSDDRKERLFALLAQRQPAYASIEHHIDVTRRSPEAIVAEARALLARGR